MTRRDWLVVLVLVSGTVVLTSIALINFVWTTTEYEADRARRAREWASRVRKSNISPLYKELREIVAALESHREFHGRYPEGLTELSGYERGWSDWRYEVDEAGEVMLWIGDYFLHGFVIGWSSTNGWIYDT